MKKCPSSAGISLFLSRRLQDAGNRWANQAEQGERAFEASKTQAARIARVRGS
jgi:hypothetical protein